MFVSLEVVLWASILLVYAMLASSPTKCCIVKASCRVNGRMIFVMVCSCCMSGCVSQVGKSWVLIVRMALMRWYVIRCYFQKELLFAGKNTSLWVSLFPPIECGSDARLGGVQFYGPPRFGPLGQVLPHPCHLRATLDGGI